MKISEAAKKAGVSEDTVCKWLWEGKLKPIGFCHLGSEQYQGQICSYSLNSFLAKRRISDMDDYLKQILNAIEDGIMVVDLNANLIYANEALWGMLLMKEHSQDERNREITGSPYWRTVKSHLEHLNAGKSRSEEVVTSEKNGTQLRLHIISTAMTNPSGQITGMLSQFKI